MPEHPADSPLDARTGSPASSGPADLIVLRMFAALERLREALDSLYSPAGLNEHKFVVLTALAERAPTPALPSELARQARITRSSMTDILDDLERRAWVRRWRDTHDRRLIRVALTPGGETMLRAAQQHFATVCRELLRETTPFELARFAELCVTVDRAAHGILKRVPVFLP